MSTRETVTITLENFIPMVLIATANTEHSPTSSLININHHLLKTEIYSFTVQEARCPKSRFRSVGAFSETLRKKLSHASPLRSGGCQKSLTFLRL